MFSFEGMIYRADNGFFETDKKSLGDFLKKNVNWEEVTVKKEEPKAKKETKKKESKKED